MVDSVDDQGQQDYGYDENTDEESATEHVAGARRKICVREDKDIHEN